MPRKLPGGESDPRSPVTEATAKREAAAVLAGTDSKITQAEIDTALRHMHARWHKSYGLVEVG